MSKIPEDLRLLLFGTLASVCVFLPVTKKKKPKYVKKMLKIKCNTHDFGVINIFNDTFIHRTY